MAAKMMTALLTMLITALLICAGCGGGGGTPGGYSGGGGGGSSTTGTTAPQLTAAGNLTNPGKPIAPMDWIEVTGSGFGSSQGGSYVGFTNGSTTTRADLYDSLTDAKIVCRVPEGTPMSDRYAVREVTQIFVSLDGIGNSNTIIITTTPISNPYPQPTPPAPSPTPTPTVSPATSPSPGGGGGGGTPPSAAKLAFSVQPPATCTADDTFSVTVEIQDASGNRVAPRP